MTRLTTSELLAWSVAHSDLPPADAAANPDDTAAASVPPPTAATTDAAAAPASASASASNPAAWQLGPSAPGLAPSTSSSAAAPAPSAAAVASSSTPLDTRWLDVILGKEDAVRMKECMAQMEDAATDVDARLVAADDLSMLVESLDNANDLRPLGLWPRLFALLRGAPEAELRSAIAFVIATAVANNERSQTDLVDAGGFPVLVDAFERETDDDVLVRVLSCFAQVVQHHEKAFTLLIEANVVNQVLFVLERTSSERLKKRACYLIANLLSSEHSWMTRQVHATMNRSVALRVLPALTSDDPDTLAKRDTILRLLSEGATS